MLLDGGLDAIRMLLRVQVVWYHRIKRFDTQVSKSQRSGMRD
jgi:hypothetical protein